MGFVDLTQFRPFLQGTPDRAVVSLHDLKRDGDVWISDQGINSRQTVKMHFGSVVAARVGTRQEKRADVFGDVVATAVVMRSRGFALTAQAFRKLSPKTRWLFKKHMPSISYMSFEERHRE